MRVPASRVPAHHSRAASATSAGSRSRERRSTQAVPLVAIQLSTCQWVGGLLDGSGHGRAPSGWPAAASRSWNRMAISRWPRSLGCSRSALQIRRS